MSNNLNARGQINPGFAFETLDEAKENLPNASVIITEDRSYYYCVRRDLLEHYLELGYELVEND